MNSASQNKYVFRPGRHGWFMIGSFSSMPAL
jgi:hypothetical protein